MADSIAKLSVIITGDSSPLGRATQQGAQYVRQFEVQTAGSMTTVGNSAKAMNAAFAVASGNLTKLSGLATFGWVGLIAVAAAAAGKLAFNLAVASDALEVAAGGNALDTWAGQWDRVQAAALSIAQTLGHPISEALTRGAQTLANILEGIATGIMPEHIRQERQLAAEMEKRKKLAEEIAKKEREAAEAASKAFQSAQDKAKSAAERITASLRTPAEIYADTLAELNKLFYLGFLNVDNLTRGISKARADLLATNSIAEARSSRSPSPAISAAERFTSAGQAAVEAAKRATQQQIDLEKAQLAAAKRQEALIQETNRLLRQRTTGPTFAPAGLQ